MTKPVVLASASPRRKEILEKAGLKFLVDASETKEKLDDNMDPAELAITISLMKARSVRTMHPGSIIIAADTFGMLDGSLLGKPDNADHAHKMLSSMSGKCHEVITGFTIMDSDTGRTTSRAVRTIVHFKVLSKQQIDQYVKSGEPLGKAGAYAIQGLGAQLVDKIEGDYYNVVGLPVYALAEELARYEIELPHLSQLDRAADPPAR